ncbi:DUF1266 domain-containing protein [Flavobacterium sp. H4147]|uniref:DUF1266 domain-containing protein n=1 Tax=unclassified Flavobacterium TaxID=196869 RepID=UPI0023EBD151|nr:DUF1266 domain-containing protein [Flavobacterium sp. H4147]
MKKMKPFFYLSTTLLLAISFLVSSCGKGNTSSETIQFINGTYAIMTLQNQGDYNLVGGQPKDASTQEGIKEMLQNWWKISDLKSGMAQVAELTSEKGMDSKDFISEVKELGIDKMSKEEFNSQLSKLTDPEHKIHFQLLYDAYKDLGYNAVVGWDLGRANFLLTSFYVADFTDESTALNNSLEVTKRIQKTFKSWDEYNRSYLYGYLYWSNEDPKDQSSKYVQRQGFVTELNKDSKSPFQLKWDTKLEKDWK